MSDGQPESKSAKFKRLAEGRTQKALDAIRVIGNLSNKNNYEYTEREVNQILTALKKAIRELRQRFDDADSGGAPKFQLD